MALRHLLFGFVATAGLTALACDSDGTPSPTATVSPTASVSATATDTASATTTATATETATVTETTTATETATEAATATATQTATTAPDQVFDTGDADALAHAALFGIESLPGEGWTVTEEDVFEDGASSLSPDVAACADIIPAYEATDAASDAARVGRAKREFEQPNEGTEETDVNASVYIFENEDVPHDTLEQFGAIFGSDDFIDCFEGSLLTQLPEGATLEMTRAEPFGDVPNDGVVVAMDATVGVDGQTVDLRFETYLWQFANAGASLSITGPAAFEPAVSTSAIEALQAGLERAASGDLSTPTANPDVSFDPVAARDIALAALPELTDLPGTDWTITTEDSFSTGPFEELADSPACTTVHEAIDLSIGALAAVLADRAEREYTDRAEGEGPAEGVSSTVFVSIYDDADAPAEAVHEASHQFEDENYLDCVSDTLGAAVAFGEPFGVAPQDGAEVAFDLTLEGASLRIEFYEWAYENAVVLVGLAGDQSFFTDGVFNAFVTDTQSRLEAQQ